jgi:hypothetical protein
VGRLIIDTHPTIKTFSPIRESLDSLEGWQGLTSQSISEAY